MAFKLAELFVQIGARDDGLERTLAAIRGKLGALAGMKFQFGGGLGAALGLAGVGLGIGAIIRDAVSLESKMVALAKATDLEGDALARMKRDLLELSVTVKGVRLDALLEIATSGAKLGIATDELVKYTEGIAKVSSAMDDLPAVEIADQIGKLNTVFRLGVQGTLQLGSAIDKLADSGVSSASGILNVTQRISGSASAARISAQQATALSAALLDTGTQSELAASALLDFIASLNQVEGRKAMARTLGMDIVKFSKLVETRPIEAIQNFLAAVNKMGAAGQLKAFAEIGIKGDTHGAELMKLAKQADTLGRYIGLANHEFLSLDQINKSYSQTANTTNAQLAVMQNQLQILGDRIGSTFLPAMNTGLSLLGDLGTGLGDIFANASAEVTGWGLDFSGTVEAVSFAFRNLGDIIQHAMTRVGGAMLNAWEYLSYGGQVVGAVAGYLRDSFVEAFQMILTAANNLKDNVLAIVRGLWDHIRNGSKQPIEFKLKPILDGMQFKGDGQFRLPEFKGLSSVDNQLEAIEDRIKGREDERRKKQLDAQGKAKVGGNGPKEDKVIDEGVLSGKKKGAVSDVGAFARSLQEAVGGKGNAQERAARAAERTAAAVEKLPDKLKPILGMFGGGVEGPIWEAAGMP